MTLEGWVRAKEHETWGVLSAPGPPGAEHLVGWDKARRRPTTHRDSMGR